MKISQVPLALLLATTVLGAGCASRDAAVTTLDGQWRYQWGEPAGGPEAVFNTDGWRSSPIGQPVPGRGDADLLWLRLSLPDAGLAQPALFLSGIVGALEVWSDGQVVSSTGRIDPGGHETGQFVSHFIAVLPASAQGEEVWLRIQSHQNAIGVQARPVFGESTELQRVVMRRALPALGVAMALALVALGLLIVAGWVRSRAALAAAVFCSVCGLAIFGLSDGQAVLAPDGQGTFVCVVLGACLYAPALVWLVREVVLHEEPRWMKAVGLGLWGLAGVIAGASLLDATLLPRLGVALVLMILVGLGATLFTAIRESRQGSVEARLFLLGASGLALTTVVDTLPTLGVNTGLSYTLHWGVLSLLAGFGAVLVRRIVRSAKDIRSQAHTMEAKTQEIRASNVRLLSDAADLLSAVDQLRQSGTAQNIVVEKQAAALHETQVTAEELKRTSALAEQKAHLLLESAGLADEAGRTGEQTVRESLEGIEAIGREVEAMAQRMDAVEELAREIGGIVAVVKELADQSNMLALNAAIEAVRSGEHGKGFAVVAREVRRLADQSLQATGRIREVLERLADGVKQSAEAGTRGEQSVAQALDKLRGSGEHIRTMSQMLQDTNSAVRQISAAVTQQNAGITQLFSVVEHLSDQMNEAVERIREADAATTEVEAIAGRLSSVA